MRKNPVQPDLWERGRISVRARKSDPETSRDAADDFDSKQEKAQRSVQAVVLVLRRYGPLTDFQIQDLWSRYWEGPFSNSLPRKARHWARQAALVKHEGYGKHQGRTVRKWALGADLAYFDEQVKAKKCPHCGGDL